MCARDSRDADAFYSQKSRVHHLIAKGDGQRKSLEQFGVSDFGMKSVIKSAGINVPDGQQAWKDKDSGGTRLGYDDYWDDEDD